MKIPFIFKYVFYSCIAMTLIQYALFTVNVFQCSPFNILFAFVLYALIATHLFVMWVSRLYYTFKGSYYAKSSQFYMTTMAIFTALILTAIGALLVFMLNIYRLIGSFLLVATALGYMAMSIWLMLIFARHLFTLITSKLVTMRFKSAGSLRRKSESIELSTRDQRIVQCISRYLVLGLCSVTSTLCVFGFAIFDLIRAQFGAFSLDLDIFILLLILDVFVNVVCIYLSFNFAKARYSVCCNRLDEKIIAKVEHFAVSKLRRKTFAWYSSQFRIGSGEVDEFGLDGMEMDHDDDPERVPTFPSVSCAISPHAMTAGECAKEMNDDEAVALKLDHLDFDKLMDFNTVRHSVGHAEDAENATQPHTPTDSNSDVLAK